MTPTLRPVRRLRTTRLLLSAIASMVVSAPAWATVYELREDGGGVFGTVERLIGLGIEDQLETLPQTHREQTFPGGYRYACGDSADIRV